MLCDEARMALLRFDEVAGVSDASGRRGRHGGHVRHSVCGADAFWKALLAVSNRNAVKPFGSHSSPAQRVFDRLTHPAQDNRAPKSPDLKPNLTWPLPIQTPTQIVYRNDK